MPDWDCLGWARTEVMIFHVDGGGPQGNDVDVDDGASYGKGLDESTAAKDNPHFCTNSQALCLCRPAMHHRRARPTLSLYCLHLGLCITVHDEGSSSSSVVHSCVGGMVISHKCMI